MKKFTFALLLCFICITSVAQERVGMFVFDAAHVAAINAEAAKHKRAYDSIVEQEGKTNQLLTTATILQGHISAIQDTTIQYLQTVHNVLRQLSSLVTIYELGTKAVNNVDDIWGMLIDDPLLTPVVSDLAVALNQEVAELYQYIQTIVLRDGTENLMYNADRAKIIIHVKTKMHKLVALTNQMRHKLKYAKKHGLIQTLCPRLCHYTRSNIRLATRIVEEFQF